MKPEYKERLLSNIDTIKKRIDILNEMVNRTRPSSDQEVRQHLMGITKILENTENLIDVS
jgi:hypothetical protein